MLFEDQVSNIEAPAHNEKVEKDKQPSLDFELGTKLLKHFFVPSELTVAHSSTLKFQMKSLEQAMDQIDFFFCCWTNLTISMESSTKCAPTHNHLLYDAFTLRS